MPIVEVGDVALYRQYEDPYFLEKLVREQEAYCACFPEDVDAELELNSLRQRLNFAWQDEEYNMPDTESWLY